MRGFHQWTFDALSYEGPQHNQSLSLPPPDYRGCSELYHMPLVDYKNHKEGMPYEFKFPFRTNNNNAKWPRTSSSPQARTGSMGGTLIKAPPPESEGRSAGVLPRSASSDSRPVHPKR